MEKKQIIRLPESVSKVLMKKDEHLIWKKLFNLWHEVNGMI